MRGTVADARLPGHLRGNAALSAQTDAFQPVRAARLHEVGVAPGAPHANVEAREIAIPKYGIFGPGWEKYIYV